MESEKQNITFELLTLQGSVSCGQLHGRSLTTICQDSKTSPDLRACRTSRSEC